MIRRNPLIFLVVVIVFILAALVVLPIDEGTLGGKGLRYGLDLQGGVHIIYQADLSSIEAGGRGDVAHQVRQLLPLLRSG